jgi:hypothetical protein
VDVTNSQMLQGLYGSHINRTKAVGYCYYHKCHLTVATLKQHECLKKECNALKKHDHDYWRQREVIKKKKKENKLKRGVH